ncbi:phage adaptor protein [Solidesulfovibrio sp.]
MNLHQMQERVRVIVDDDKLVDNHSLALFNQGMLEVATLVNLPALDTWGTLPVAAAASNAALPAGFMRELHTVRDNVRPDVEIPIVSGLQALAAMHGVQGVEKGPIETCCEEGGVLYFAPQPVESATLTVGYYREPAPLALATDVPVCIPVAFHEAVLVNYVAAKLHALIEDGMSGETANFNRYMGMYQQGVEALAAKYPDTSRKRVARVRRARWF